LNTKDKSFAFKPVDEEGMETLDVLSSANKFNRWMYESIGRDCVGNILEIGSGIGNISAYFLKDNRPLHLSDIRPIYCERLQQRFGSEPSLQGISQLDIATVNFETTYPELVGKFDTVFILNVVEHIQDDRLAIGNCMKLLKKYGKLIVLVPAYQSLYNGFDEGLEHYRRYNKKNLISLLKTSGLTIVKSYYFNLIGILGWYVSGKIEKNKTIPAGEMKLYNYFVPIFRIVDRIFLNSAGLSVIAVARKD
jgi:2-polyprenyl-3-methyl-5-hydroxy-6-metoxy-1,4-benzoquinol methylase